MKCKWTEGCKVEGVCLKDAAELRPRACLRQVEALAQFESKHQKYLADAKLTAAEQEKKEGLLAEGKRHFEEVRRM